MTPEAQARLEFLRKQALGQRQEAERLQADVDTLKELVKGGAATWAEAVNEIRENYGFSLRYLQDMGIIGILKHAQGD